MLKTCPLCQTRKMKVTRISCECCHLSVEGDIHVPPLARLTGDEMRLAEALVLAGGNLKALAGEIGISYPTLRKRLDQVVARVREERDRDQEQIEAILSRIEAGEMDAEAGIRSIREIRHEL
jgi:hypothetical protein